MTKKIEHEVAAARMRERGADPQEEYPGANKKWHCLCMECGADIWPRYASVVSNGYKPCLPCSYFKRGRARAVPHDEAVAFMLKRDFQPNVPYTNSLTAWQGVCLKCGQPGSPRVGDVKQGGDPCGYCSGQRIDTAVARGKMLAANFQPDPNIPFPGSRVPWHGVCLVCNQPGSPEYGNVNQGGGACRGCAEYGYRTSKTGYFYFVASNDWLKGGITNTPKIRLAAHRRQKLTEVLHIWEYKDGMIPVDLERLWKEYRNSLPDNPIKADLEDGYREATRRTIELEQWIERTFKPLADDLLAAPLAA